MTHPLINTPYPLNRLKLIEISIFEQNKHTICGHLLTSYIIVIKIFTTPPLHIWDSLAKKVAKDSPLINRALNLMEITQSIILVTSSCENHWIICSHCSNPNWFGFENWIQSLIIWKTLSNTQQNSCSISHYAALWLHSDRTVTV